MDREDWPPVVVLGAFQTGVVLMRDLSKRGLRVEAIDFNPEQPGFKTIYGPCHLCPNPDLAPQEWVRFMVNLATRLGERAVLIPSADQFVSALAEHSEQLAPHFYFLPASVNVQALLATKKRQYALAETGGLPVPFTRYIENEQELQDFVAIASFPCLIKPVHFREWERFPEGHPLLNEKIVLAHSPGELLEKYRLAAVVSGNVVAQEVIQGPDTNKMVYLACYRSDGVRLASLLLRQLRTAPIHFGSASIVEPIQDDKTNAVCDEFLKQLYYVGIVELELKLDDRDGQVRLIEANPRYSVTADAAVYAGLELGWLHYLDLVGKNPLPVDASSKPFRHIVLRRDFGCVRSYRAAGLLTWRQIIASYAPPVGFFDFDLRDRRVTWDTVVLLAKAVLGAPIRKVFPRKKR